VAIYQVLERRAMTGTGAGSEVLRELAHEAAVEAVSAVLPLVRHAPADVWIVHQGNGSPQAVCASGKAAREYIAANPHLHPGSAVTSWLVHGVVGVQDARYHGAQGREGLAKMFSPEAWAAFVAGVKAGEFDLPGDDS
jgi:hypothetical protein